VHCRRELIFVFVISFLLPMVISSTIVIILNFHLTIKANKIHKQIEQETSLSGQSKNVTSLKKKQRIIRQNRKPIITLLHVVVILGSASINMILAVFFFAGRVWITSPAYHDLMEFVIVHNTVLVMRFLYPLVYGLCFKQNDEAYKETCESCSTTMKDSDSVCSIL